MNQETQDMNTPREDKLDGELQLKKSPFVAWLDNFWYHYKWHTLITVFFVAVLTMCVVQMFTRPTYDVNFVVASSYYMDNEQHANYEKVLEEFLPEDYDGNGEKSVNIVAYNIYSDEEIREEQSLAEAETRGFVFNTTHHSKTIENYNTYTMSGECSVYLVSPHLYQTLSTADPSRLMSIKDLYAEDELPAGVTEDGNGIYIKYTHFYKYNEHVRVLPDDMILCFLRPVKFGKNNNEAAFERDKAFFRSIVDYRVTESE